MVQVQTKSWSIEQCSRRECLEIVGIAGAENDSSFEGTGELNIFEELNVSSNSSDIEACHHEGPSRYKKVITKMPRWKDKDRMQRVKKSSRVLNWNP